MATYENTAQFKTVSQILHDITLNTEKQQVQKPYVSTNHNYPKFTPPTGYKSWDPESVKRYIVHPKFTAVSALHIPGTQKLFKRTQTYQQTQPCIPIYNRLCTKYPTCVSKSENMVGNNGTIEGLLKRRVGFTPKGKWSVPVKLIETLVDRLPLAMKFRNVEVPHTYMESFLNCKVNQKSNPGFPFIYHDQTPVTETYFPQIMDQLNSKLPILLNYKGSDNDAVREFLRALKLEDAGLVTVLMNRKLDRYPRTDFSNKCRAYFIYPALLKMLVLPIGEILRSSIVKFDDADADDLCTVAYKFSWVGGGAQKLHDWIMKTEVNQVKGISYGDDVLMVANVKGKYYVVCPDVSGMDMSLDADITNWLLLLVSKMSDEKWFQRTLILSLATAFNMDVSIAYSLVYRISRGLFSGHVLTTVIDTLMSSMWITIFTLQLSRQLNLGGDVHSVDIVKFVKENFDMNLKEGTTTWVEYTSPVSMPPFLGMKLHISKNNKIVPIRDTEDIALSCIIPKQLIPESKSGITTLERISGVYLCGGWCDENISSALIDYYEDAVKQGITPNWTSETEEIAQPNVKEALSPYRVLPPYEAVEILYTLGTTEFHNYMSSYLSSATVDVHGMEHMPVDFDFVLPNLEGFSRGEVVKIAPVPILVEKMDKYHARTIAQDNAKVKMHKAKKDKWEAEKQARMAMFADKMRDKKGKKVMKGMLRNIVSDYATEAYTTFNDEFQYENEEDIPDDPEFETQMQQQALEEYYLQAIEYYQVIDNDYS